MLSIRKIGAIGRTYRNLNRFSQILSVLFKHGFGDLLEVVKLDHYVEAGMRMLSRKDSDRPEKLSRPQRLRMVLEELGPTYIKLGQILSTRPDLIQVEYLNELTKLQDKVPSFDAAEAGQIIADEFGFTPNEIFARFDEQPLASASIGQVHRARLNNGTEVAVKVQRPGIRRNIEIDLEIMLHLATLMERHIEELALHRPVKIVEEFAKSLEKELDYRLEAFNMERVAQNFSDDPYTCIPKVFREFSTAQVLTTEFVDGIKVSDIHRIESAGLDRKIITDRGAGILLKMVFEHGFFQADPHPGNIFVLPENVICLIDFGMVGAVDRRTKENFVDLLDGIVQKDSVRTAEVFLQIADRDEEPDGRAFEADIAEFMAQHLYRPLKDIQIGKLVQQLLELASRYHLRIPPTIFLMMKSLTTIEGVARLLDPEFDIFAKVSPYIKGVMLERFAPRRVSLDIYRMAVDFKVFLAQFPKDLLEITRMIRQQKIQLKFDSQEFKESISTLDRASNRLSFAVIIAALIVGSAIVLQAQIPPMVFGFSLIGIIGFTAAAVMGFWLLIAILRKGRL